MTDSSIAPASPPTGYWPTSIPPRQNGCSMSISGFRTVVPVRLSVHERTHGRVVVVGSIASRQTFPGNNIYAASKAAVAALIRGIATENGRRGLTANCIEPRFIDTDMIAAYSGKLPELMKGVPTRRTGTPSEVANLVAFLLSEGASYINGECIAVDGGMSAGTTLRRRLENSREMCLPTELSALSPL